MPRKKIIIKKRSYPDKKYNDPLIGQFIGTLMKDGKKSVAEGIIYGAFDIMKDKGHADPVAVFNKALENSKPRLEVKPRRVGGATYQVPVDVRYVRRVSLAIRWLANFARKRKEKSMKEKLAFELIEAASNGGGAVKKVAETHKMAEANRAFSHFRW